MTNGADRVAKSVAGRQNILLDRKDWLAACRRRKKYAKDLEGFCRHYLAQRFLLKSSDDQRESLQKIQHAALTGGQFAQAAPRGDGKTQRAVAGALWSTLYGHRRYVMVVAATGEHSKRLVQEMEAELAGNDLLYRDWPEVCRAVRRAFERPTGARYIAVNGVLCGVEAGSKKLIYPTVKGMGDLGGIIVEGAGVTAAFRGMRHTTKDGQTRRPELAILDDLQTRKSAMSVGQTERVMAILRGDIKRLAGPDKELAVVVNCTVVRRGDAADQLLDNKANPQWRGVRKKMVYEWPKRKDLWAEYASIRKRGLLDGDSGRAGNAFYANHRADMDEGGAVGWNYRYRKDAGEISALQCAQNILIDDGEEAFQAECQNEPLEKSYTFSELKPDIVMQRTNGLPAGSVNELVRTCNAFVDPNKGWLAWAVMGWQADFTGYVIGYGTHSRDAAGADHRWTEKEPRGETLQQFMARNLVELVPTILKAGAFARSVDRCLVDIGWGDMQDTMLGAIVHLRDAQKLSQVIPARGSPNFRFKPDVERYEFAQFQEWPGKGPVMVSNTNWHKMKVHAALSQQAGTPGSVTLYGDSPAHHREFALSVCAERLEAYHEGTRDGDAGMFKWVRVPAQRNEMLDCLAGCRVAACWWKVTTGAAMPVTASQPSQPQAPAVLDPVTRQPLAVSDGVSYDSGWG